MSILDFIVLLPILAAIAAFAGMPARLSALTGSGLMLLLTGVALALFPEAPRDDAGFAFVADRLIAESPAWSYAVGADGLTMILLLLTALVAFCAAWTSPVSQTGGYYGGCLLIAAGAAGAFVSTDLFFFYAFHELALVPTFLLIGIYGFGEKRAAAWKITIYLGAASLVVLAGLAALVLHHGDGGLTFSIVELQQRAAAAEGGAPAQAWIYLTLLLGFGALVSLFPLHSWAAPAYAAAPTPVAMLHAGVLKKFGIYGLIRVAQPILPEGAAVDWILNLTLLLLLGNILIMGLATIAQRRLEYMVAYSSVMHMGYLFLGLAGGSEIGRQGAIMLMFAHGASVALLFLLCGKMRREIGHTDFDKLGGLAKTVPVMTLLFGIAAFASIGLPGFGNFAGEVLVFFGAFDEMRAGSGVGALQIAAMVAVWGVVISAVYMLRAYRAVFLGEPGGPAPLTDLDLRQRVPAVLLVLALLVAGVAPGLLLQLLDAGPDGAVEATVAAIRACCP